MYVAVHIETEHLFSSADITSLKVKVRGKVVQRLTKHQSKKRYWGSGFIAFFDLGTRWK
jgi:hypothetical protein